MLLFVVVGSYPPVADSWVLSMRLLRAESGLRVDVFLHGVEDDGDGDCTGIWKT